MAQLRGISRTTQDAPPHSEDKHGPGRRAHRGITNKFHIVASPLGKGERMKVRGLNCTSQLANFFEPLTLPSPWQGSSDSYRVSHSTGLTSEPTISLQAYAKSKIAFAYGLS